MTEHLDATANEDTTGKPASPEEVQPNNAEKVTSVSEAESEMRPDPAVVDIDSTVGVEDAETAPVAEAEEEVVTAEVIEEVTEAAVTDADSSGGDETAAQATQESGQAKPLPDDVSRQEEHKRVVRMLAVGQRVDGVVKRITEFGAFVDIGVGRDGLIHISELSPRRVAKVSDVLTKDQEVRPWIKKLDRKRNRISLTLIDPEMKTIRDLQAGEIVQGTVTRILPYGAFVDIGIGRDALLHVREMSKGYVEKPEDVVQVGETIEARIIEVSRRRGRVDLSLKGLHDEPEPEPEAEPVEEEIPDEADQFEEEEVLSPMELAFKRAVEAEGAEIKVGKKKKGKRSRRRETRSIQDEIIARTLNTARK